VPDVTNPFMAELIAAIENAASQHGWMLSLMNCQLNGQRELAYLQTAFGEVPDGILYIPMTPDAAGAIEQRLETGPPTVFVDSITSRAGVGGVTADNDQGARLAARHFRAVGRRRVLYTGPPVGLPTHRTRGAAFLDEASAVGIEIAHSGIGDVRFEDAVAVATTLWPARTRTMPLSW
jgi:LacI family transcriptional regulator